MVAGAVLAFVGALWLARLLLSRSCRVLLWMLLAASRCATCLFSGARTNVAVATAVCVVVVHVVLGVEAAAVVVVVGPPWFWRDVHGEIEDEKTRLGTFNACAE